MSHQPIRPSRRELLASGTVALAAAPFIHLRPLDDKLRLGVVGCGGRGAANLGALLGEEVVALSDVDANNLEAGRQAVAGRGGKPALFRDFRRMLEKVELDGVVVSTADHTHAHVTLAALAAGLPVYCEKPLTHTTREVRAVRAAAREAGVATQMGTQIHAGDNYRRVVERLRAGAIGAVREVHVLMSKSWSDGRFGPAKPAPAHLDWDLWQGPLPARDYCDGLHPANWRRFWDYGTGTLGDMACHYVDLVHWALDLGVPDVVEAEGPEVHPVGTPSWLKVHWHHAASAARPAVVVHWYDGGARPDELPELKQKDGTLASCDNGHVFVGERGVLVSDYGNHALYPEAAFEGVEPPPQSIERSIGHHAEWARAIREATPTTCNFDYSGRLTEAVLLGNVAFRAGGRITGCADGSVDRDAAAAPFLGVRYRDGWEL